MKKFEIKHCTPEYKAISGYQDLCLKKITIIETVSDMYEMEKIKATILKSAVETYGPINHKENIWYSTYEHSYKFS